MNPETLHKLQQTELEIAIEIFRICKKHDIRCSLVGGSAIGAIRHKGFIPWDDDIDLAMPRPDYERFIEISKTEMDPAYFLQCFDTEKNCAFIFAKVRKNNTCLPENYSKHIDMHQGVWVDIFVYDKVSDDAETRKKELDRLLFFKNLLIVKTGFKMPENRTGAVANIAYALGKIAALFFPSDFLKKKCLDIMTLHRDEDAHYVFPYGGAYSTDKELMPHDIFDNLIETDFETEKFLIFAKYDRYLSSLFGDYMTPPPPEKRGANHFLDEKGIRI